MFSYVTPQAISEILNIQFPNAKIYVSTEDQSFCIIDFDSLRVVIGLFKRRGGSSNPEEPYQEIYRFVDIFEVEVQKNGTTIASTNRGSQALGATAGALAFGGIGAIIGGLSGASTQQELVCHISLVIKIRDQSKPIHKITFFTCKKGFKTSNPVVQKAIANAETFATHVANAIHYSCEDNSIINHKTNDSMSTEIKELFGMKENGILTEAEFNLAKTRLISGN